MRQNLIIFLLAFFMINISPLHAQKPSCGSPMLIDLTDKKTPGYKESVHRLTDEFKNRKKERMAQSVCTVNVVVHLVYYNNSDNLSDYMIGRQIDIMNECFSHRNADTVYLRPDFQSVTGKS